MDAGDAITTVGMYLMPLNCTFKMVKMVNFPCIFTTIKNKGKNEECPAQQRLRVLSGAGRQQSHCCCG